MKERDHVEDLHVYGRILKWISRERKNERKKERKNE
jgi:hypothetical protein